MTPTIPPVFFLIGPPQHGKTTARRILSKLTGLKGASTSDVIAGFLAERKGVSYDSVRALPKELSRAEFIEAGNWLCGDDIKLAEAPKDITVDEESYRVPSALVRALYHSGVNVIDGCRRRLELDNARSHLQWNGVRTLVLYIERPDGPKIKDNTELTKDHADEYILNDGSEADLTEKLHTALTKHFPPPKKAEPVITASARPAGPVQLLDASGNVIGANGPRGIIKPFSAL